MFILQFLAKLIKILRSAATPGQIAGGFILGMIIGLTPFWSLHNLVVLFLIIILNVNIAMALFSFALFSGVAYLADPLFHSFGFFMLVDINALQGLWLALYNIPVVALCRFNNTVVLGSLLSSLILLLPVYFLIKIAVIQYREKLEPLFLKWKIVKAIKGSRVYTWYEKIADWSE